MRDVHDPACSVAREIRMTVPRVDCHLLVGIEQIRERARRAGASSRSPWRRGREPALARLW